MDDQNGFQEFDVMKAWNNPQFWEKNIVALNSNNYGKTLAYNEAMCEMLNRCESIVHINAVFTHFQIGLIEELANQKEYNCFFPLECLFSSFSEDDLSRLEVSLDACINFDIDPMHDHKYCSYDYIFSNGSYFRDRALYYMNMVGRIPSLYFCNIIQQTHLLASAYLLMDAYDERLMENDALKADLKSFFDHPNKLLYLYTRQMLAQLSAIKEPVVPVNFLIEMDLEQEEDDWNTLIQESQLDNIKFFRVYGDRK